MVETTGPRSGESEKKLDGLIQHSFALRMPEHRRRLHCLGNRGQVAELFSLPRAEGVAGFCTRPVGAGEECDPTTLAPHSTLVEQKLTSATPRQAGFLKRKGNGDYVEERLPGAFSWAGQESLGEVPVGEPDDAKFFLARPGANGSESGNDFLIEEEGFSSEATTASRALLEILAHKRSLLFGLALANRFVNVMLPHALLTQGASGEGCEISRGPKSGPWILQPLVSFIRGGRDGSDFGRMYSLTFFLVPVEQSALSARPMPESEIRSMVNAGWNLASSPRPPSLPHFDLQGPLARYVSRLSQADRRAPNPGAEAMPLRGDGDSGSDSITLRQAVEVVGFRVALKMVRDPADCETRRHAGNDVVTSLGSARVSTLVVVDRSLEKNDVEKRMKKGGPPGRLGRLMEKLAWETRTPPTWNRAEQLKYRLDRHFVDDDTYVFGVLPQNRCLIVASVGSAQHGRRESALMQAGSVAYMTIGAATAIGTLRAIDHDLEQAGDSDPGKIAKVETEVAGYLHEIYDLDITREAYRQLYRRLRDRLGIERDYRTLQDKMSALYRATSTRHEINAGIRLEWLTAAIVLLSVLILLGTVVVAVRG